MIKELIERNRSYRRFDEHARVPTETLKELVELARLSGSAANLQPMKYILSNDPAVNAQIFSTLAWAGYLPDWHGPAEGERPAAYIILLLDTEIAKNPNVDPGIACQSMLLGAVEKDLGGCILGNVKREQLRSVLDLPQRFEILYVLALGKPAETVVIEPVGADGSIKYYRDETSVHHVPKRSLDDLVIGVYVS
jgi:nitroreductase